VPHVCELVSKLVAERSAREACVTNAVRNKGHSESMPVSELAPGHSENLLLENADDKGRAECIKVVVRIRPLLERERGVTQDNTVIVSAQGGNTVTVRGEGESRQVRCRYDVALGPATTQAELYSHVSECAAAVLEGVNSSIFAYGQTSSGKTHTMQGPSSAETIVGPKRSLRPGQDAGVIPRAVADLFSGVQAMIEAEVQHPDSAAGGGPRISLWCSLVQIYNEQVYDMLRDPHRSHPLAIHDDAASGSTYCQGLSEYAVHSAAECLQLLRTGEDHRAVRETHMNQASSRSHSIFQVEIT
jgi:Kinesin motor domain